MKTAIQLLILIFFISTVHVAHAQFRNLDKRIEQKVKNRADRKVDKAIDKALDKTEEGAEGAVKGDKMDKKEEAKGKEAAEPENTSAAESNKNAFVTYTKFDFVPGEKVMFYDDFDLDNPGDFPSKWNTNGSGEVVNAATGNKLFELKGGSTYLPLIATPLPENYTIEFDIKTSELDNKLSSQVFLSIMLDDNANFNLGKNFAHVKLPFCQYSASSITVQNRVGGKQIIHNNLSEDIRQKINEGAHVSIAVNKKRFRLWVDEKKLVDVPMLVPEKISHLKFEMMGFSKDFENYQFYITNLKVAEGTIDLRSKLITEGKFVTSGILFDINSDKIKPESAGVLKEIAKVLQDNATVKVKIVGHTDTDGDDQLNLELSKRRSQAVKAMLAKDYGIAENRLETDGKGEREPADKGTTAEAKANNRRVEFVKL